MTDPRAKLRDLIAATEAWQDATSTETAGAAAAFIFLAGSEGADANTFPQIVINGTRSSASVGYGAVSHSGEFTVNLFVEVEDSTDLDVGSGDLWEDVLAPLQEQALALAGTGTHIYLQAWDWDYQGIAPEEDKEQVWIVPATVRWGIAS